MQSPATGRYHISDDTTGLSYFRTLGWVRGDAGNEADGVRLTAAYRILNNLTGIRGTAVNNTNFDNISKHGSEAARADAVTTTAGYRWTPSRACSLPDAA